ncbi:hypothetical protein CRUP_031015, partial [Coryphaenoides rupestris]
EAPPPDTGPIAPPTTTIPEPDTDSCGPGASPVVLEKAYQFGLTKNSHMTFAFDDTKVKEGQVCLGYDLGHGNISACIPLSINDGNWHK